MTTKEVMVYLGVSRTTVENYIKLGYLKPKKEFNGRLTFDKKQVQKLKMGER